MKTDNDFIDIMLDFRECANCDCLYLCSCPQLDFCCISARMKIISSILFSNSGVFI